MVFPGVGDSGDGEAWDDAADLEGGPECYLPQSIDTRKLLDSGVEFEPSVADGGLDTVDVEETVPTDKRQYFEGLAKLNDEGHSLTDLCQGLGLDDDDETDVRQPFAVLRLRMTDLIGDGGVMKLVKVPGSGQQVPPGSRVTMHYVAQFEGHDEPFDSTYLRARGRPESHVVGPNTQLLPGLNHALLSMRKGETALVLVSPEYGYGRMGCGPRIPEQSEALFEITVISFTDSTEADEFNDLPEDQREKSSFEKKIKAIRCHHLNGNEHYSRQEYPKASKCYREAIQIFQNYMVFKNEEEEREAQRLIFKVMSNRTQALLQQNMWKEAARQGRQAQYYLDVADPPMKEKLYTRLAKAMIYLPEFGEASALLKKAARLNPRSRDVRQLTELLAERQRHSRLEELEFSRRIFQAPARSQQQQGQQQMSSGAGETQPAANPAEEPPPPEEQGSQIRVSDEFRRNIDSTLEQFLADPSRDELPLPLLHTEQGRHKLAYICVQCRKLGLRFVADEGGQRPRVTKC